MGIYSVKIHHFKREFLFSVNYTWIKFEKNLEEAKDQVETWSSEEHSAISTWAFAPIAP